MNDPMLAIGHACQVGSVAQRTGFTECLAFLREDDVLAVIKPDRLARSATELLAIEGSLSERGICRLVPSMDGKQSNTRYPTRKPMLTILAGVATWERGIMLERQREGIAKPSASVERVVLQTPQRAVASDSQRPVQAVAWKRPVTQAACARMSRPPMACACPFLIIAVARSQPASAVGSLLSRHA